MRTFSTKEEMIVSYVRFMLSNDMIKDIAIAEEIAKISYEYSPEQGFMIPYFGYVPSSVKKKVS